jgi:hypothetical protein
METGETMAQVKRIPWESVELFEFQGNEAPLLGELVYHDETKKWHYDRLHAVGKDGRLVCNCKLANPAKVEFMYLGNFEPVHRWVVCPQSREFLRVYTTKLIVSRNKKLEQLAEPEQPKQLPAPV